MPARVPSLTRPLRATLLSWLKSPLIAGTRWNASGTPPRRRWDRVGMKVEFTNNVLARMLDRGIPEPHVRAALDAPDYLGPSFEKRWQARKRIDRRMLEVIFWRHRASAQVITAYWQDTPA